jgi:hypothetical protein
VCASLFWTGEAINPVLVLDPPVERVRGGLRHSEAGHVPTLPRHLDSLGVVVLAHIGDCVPRRHPIEYRQQSQRRPSPTSATIARDLHSLMPGASPSLAQRVLSIKAIRRQLEIGPADPAGLPLHGRWRVGQQIHPEVRVRGIQRWSAQSAATHNPTRRQREDAGSAHLPPTHDNTLLTLAVIAAAGDYAGTLAIVPRHTMR